MLTGAAAIHYTSDEERRLVETELGLSGGVVVPNGLDLSFIKRRTGPFDAPRSEIGNALMSWPFRAFIRKRDSSC